MVNRTLVANLILVGIGGALGAIIRFGVNQVVAARWGTHFPFGTFLINISGSFVIGLALTLLLGRNADAAWRLVLVVGLLGGYTTFSAYAFELVTLLGAGNTGSAALYLIASNALGIAACLVGVVLARAMLGA